MHAAAILRRHEDISNDSELLKLKKTIEDDIASSWKEFSMAYELYLDSLEK